jgi:hypothetical protein
MLEIIEYIFVIFVAIPLFGFFGIGMLITFVRWLFSVFDNEDLFDNFLEKIDPLKKLSKKQTFLFTYFLCIVLGWILLPL